VEKVEVFLHELCGNGLTNSCLKKCF